MLRIAFSAGIAAVFQCLARWVPLLVVVAASSGAGAQEARRDGAGVLRLATTTIAEPLLRNLAPRFAEAARIELRLVVLPAKEAGELARGGTVDLLVLDDERIEKALLDSGDASARHDMMYAELVVVGPAADPAGIAGMASAVHAFAAIARTRSLFVSRDDGGLVDRIERAIWDETGAAPKPGDTRWFLRAGRDTAATLALAAERNAYAITDKAAWLQLANRRQLVVVTSDDPRLQQRLALTMVNAERHKTVNKRAAEAFAAWATSFDAQRLIGAYAVRGEYPFAPHFGLSRQ
jgi:tungstate transport system substrate-binding protein